VHHRRGLRRLLRDDELADAIESDWSGAPLDARRRAMVDYAARLTRTPWQVTRDDLQPMRDAGLSETDILHVAQLTGYYAYVNRIANGLGVELEP
jgi:uncharacterized peroxidase-related enzyme